MDWTRSGHQWVLFTVTVALDVRTPVRVYLNYVSRRFLCLEVMGKLCTCCSVLTSVTHCLEPISWWLHRPVSSDSSECTSDTQATWPHLTSAALQGCTTHLPRWEAMYQQHVAYRGRTVIILHAYFHRQCSLHTVIRVCTGMVCI